jgi:hypothetical protein
MQRVASSICFSSLRSVASLRLELFSSSQCNVHGRTREVNESYLSVERRREIMIIARIIPTRGELQKRFYENGRKTRWFSLCNERKLRLETPHVSFTEGSNGSGNYRVIDLSSEKPTNHKNASLPHILAPAFPALLSNKIY